MNTVRILIAGMSGSGKTSNATRPLVKKFIREGRYHQLVIVNRKAELADLCEKAYAVDESADPGKALNRYSRVFFRVDGHNPTPFLDALGTELLTRRNCLVVFVEAYEFLPRGRVSKPLFSVITRGRALGHNMIFDTQMLQSAMGGIDVGVIQQCTHLVTFKLQGEPDVKRSVALFPELGEGVTRLARPLDGLPPEFAVRDMSTGRCGVLVRSSSNPKKRIYKDLTYAEQDGISSIMR
jgi:hypothetical protein